MYSQFRILRELCLTFVNFKYNIHKCEVQCTAFALTNLLCFCVSSCFILLDVLLLSSSASSLVPVWVVQRVFNHFISCWILHIGRDSWKLSSLLGPGCLWNCSTECCQFYWIPPFPGVLHLWSMWSWSKVMYRSLLRIYFQKQVARSEWCADCFPCFQPVIDILWYSGPHTDS